MALTANTYSGIKSIQRGTLSMSGAASSATATVTAVNTAKAFLSTNQSVNADATGIAYTSLTNSTTITANRSVTGNQTIVAWELVEWY